MAHITADFVNKVQPPAKGYKIHWDQKLPGFGIRVGARNSKGQVRKSFLVQGRLKGVSVSKTIGPLGRFTAEEARAHAKQLLKGLSLGEDPRRRQPEGVPTLRKLADEYMARPGKDMKASSKAAIDRHVKTTFKDTEHRLITEITEAYCIERYERLLYRGLHGNRVGGSPGQANQAHAILKALLGYAIRKRKGIDKNPCDAVTHDDRKVLKPRTSYIKPNRIGAVWNWLKQRRDESYTQGAMGRYDLAMFLLWTGCRLSEALTLEWNNVNLDEGWWHLPDPKNRNPIWLPLSSQAMAMLKVRRKEVPQNVSWVFPSYRSASGHMEDPREILWKPISDIAGEPITAHDCRRAFTNYGWKVLRLDYYKIELLTGHKPTSVTLKHYTDIQDLMDFRTEVQAIADWIENQALVAAAANVIQLPVRKAG